MVGLTYYNQKCLIKLHIVDEKIVYRINLGIVTIFVLNNNNSVQKINNNLT